MAKVYKRAGSDHYTFEFYFNGRRRRVCTKQSDKKTAYDLMAVERSKLARQKAGIESPDDAPLFEQAAEKFLKAGRAKDGAPRDANTRRGYKVCIAILKAEFGGRRLSSMDGADVERFKTDQLAKGKAHGTVNRYLSCLRRMYALAGVRSPFGRDKVRLLDEEESREKRRRLLTANEEQRYLAACSPILRDVALLVLRCGLRPSEVFNLQPADVYLQEGFLHVRESKSTSGLREVPLTRETRDLLKRRMAECNTVGGAYLFPLRTATAHDWSQPMTTVKTAHRTALRESKVKRFRLYDLRHCYATAQLAAGTDLLTLQALMGHTELETTSIYAKVQRGRKVQATKGFERYLAEREITEAEKAASAVSQSVQ